MASFRHPRAKATPRARRDSPIGHVVRGVASCRWRVPSARKSVGLRLSRLAQVARHQVRRRRRPCRQPVDQPPQRLRVAAGLAPVGSPGVVSVASAPWLLAARSGRRRGVRPVWCAVRPPAVSHSRAAGDGSVVIDTTADLHVEGLRAGLEGAGHLDPVERQQLVGGRPAAARRSRPGSPSPSRCPAAGRRGRRGPPRPPRARRAPRAAPRRGPRRTDSGSTRSVTEISKYSASLAVPVGRRVRVADLGVRVEAGRERHRHPGPAQRPLEGALEVAGRGEPQPTPLGVPDPQLLHRRGGGGSFGNALPCHGRQPRAGPKGSRPRNPHSPARGTAAVLPWPHGHPRPHPPGRAPRRRAGGIHRAHTRAAARSSRRRTTSSAGCR